MNKDWLFTDDKYTCGLRTAGVLIKDNMILVQKDKSSDEYALPGGHVKIGETLENALVREMSEELGIKIKCVRMLWSEECFWEWNGKQTHTVCFYFQTELCAEADIPEDKFIPQKDNGNVLIGRLPVDELKNVIVYPTFLKEEIYRLNGEIKHFVSNC